MTAQGNAPIYYLKLEQTVYQKCLIDIIIELHKPHLLKYLQNHKTLDFGDVEKQKQTNIMSDDSMIEALIFNMRQIINHPTLLVDHYIPRNFLLLNSKENIITLSNKYHKVSEILDKLVEKDAKKTIIISVSNAKEMDLVESFLLGKTGLQYYRFSGSSLYYDNHGSFDFHKASHPENDHIVEFAQLPSEYNSSSSSTPPVESKKRKQKRAKKLVTSTKEKKKSGRPSNVERKARENVDAESGSGHNKRDREEYIPRLSKNSEKYIQMIQEKKNKKLNVYLILSSQLKYLVQFEDLRSDLIFSLDSHTTNFDDLSAILGHQVPIIKPLIVESLEHYESELLINPDVIYDNNQTLRNQKTDGKSETQQKVEFNRLLAFLSVAAWPDVKMKLPSNISPVSNDFIEWLINPTEIKFPYSRTIATELPHILDKDLIDKVINTLDNFQEDNTLQGGKIDRYKFFNVNHDIKDEVKLEHDSKRVRANPKNENVPDSLNYAQYQLCLTKLINDSFIDTQEWITTIESKLQFVHLDETERQFIIDKGNAECGELYKKDRDLDVTIEGRSKMKEKLVSEFEKVDSVRKMLNDRFQRYKALTTDDKDKKKQNDEIKTLQEKLIALKATMVDAENNSDTIRKKYQEKSSEAAELSAYVQNIEETSKFLKNESKGVFRSIQLQSIKEQQMFIDKKIKEHTNNCNMWSGYLETLHGELEKRSSATLSTGLRIPRSSRNNTPY